MGKAELIFVIIQCTDFGFFLGDKKEYESCLKELSMKSLHKRASRSVRKVMNANKDANDMERSNGY